MPTLYLRNKHNETLADIEVYGDKHDLATDVKAVINIENYSHLLVNNLEDYGEMIIEFFIQLSEIHIWHFDTLYEAALSTSEVTQMIEEAHTGYVFKELDLEWVVD